MPESNCIQDPIKRYLSIYGYTKTQHNITSLVFYTSGCSHFRCPTPLPLRMEGRPYEHLPLLHKLRRHGGSWGTVCCNQQLGRDSVRDEISLTPNQFRFCHHRSLGVFPLGLVIVLPPPLSCPWILGVFQVPERDGGWLHDGLYLLKCASSPT